MAEPNPLTHQQIFERLSAAYSNSGLVIAGGRVPATVVPVEHLHAVCRYLRDDPELAFDYPVDILSVDYIDSFEVIYQLRSFTHHHDVNVKCRVDREDAQVPSVVDIWRGADFQEREIYDLMGIVFSGHPNLTRILLWDEFEGYPLRKDFGIPAPMPADVELALHSGIQGGDQTQSVGSYEHKGGAVPGSPGTESVRRD